MARKDRSRPNILFLFPDQWRFDWLGSNPAIPVRTPNLDGLQSRGLTFTRAISPSPLCAPCRACLASGMEYERCGAPENADDYPLNRPTFYGLLRESGYHVAGCGKFDLNKGMCTTRQSAWGLDGKRFLREWGFSDGINNEGKMDGVNSGRDTPRGPYLKYLDELGLRETHVADFDARSRKRDATFPTPLSEEAYCDNWVARNGLQLLASAPPGSPWFLQVNFTGPHPPWDITEEMAGLYADVEFPVPAERGNVSPEGHQAVRRNYSAMIENIDRWIGAYLEAVEQRGELTNTAIVFSSDPGEMLGDRGLWGKTHPYQPSVGAPLIISGPGVRSGETCDLPSTILDLAATFLDWGGVPVPDDMDSRSLTGLLAGETGDHRPCVRSGYRDWRLAFDGRYKLIDGLEEGRSLYDHENDPSETVNLSGDPELLGVVDELSQHPR